MTDSSPRPGILTKIRTHLTIIAIATICGLTAYGFIHLLIYAIEWVSDRLN